MLLGAVSLRAEGPFTVSPRLLASNGVTVVQVAFGVPTNHFLYHDKLHFELGEAGLSSFNLPEPVVVTDKFSGKQKHVFGSAFVASATLPAAGPAGTLLTVRYQGCDEANCFFPEELKFVLSANGEVVALAQEQEPTADTAETSVSSSSWRTLVEDFTVSARGSGYLNEKEFLAFLDKAESGQVASEEKQAGGFLGLLLAAGLILLGGLALNLTPCVLPMIPINIAIIGAGAQASSKKRGFALGATYAAGMAVAYGALGAIVMLTGSKFGTINSSPWFNLIIALVFVVLALGMFDVLTIDLSRFQGQSGGASNGGSKSKFVAAYSMGTVAALLAGACVAPVVISVLLQATTFYNQGVIAGLFLPFLLGIGMGLPWPFAGAGLSFLPKPGRWMTRVKYGFGVFIALFALYYGQLSLGLFRSNDGVLTASASTPSGQNEPTVALGEQLAQALTEARATGRPVFIDFWASWCKNCSAMEHTTFAAAPVKERLAAFREVRLQAERPNRSPAKEVLDYFNVLGLPSYIVLTPKNPAPAVKTVAAVSSTAK